MKCIESICVYVHDEQASSQNPSVGVFFSQLIFIVIFSRSGAIRVTLIYKDEFNGALARFLGKLCQLRQDFKSIFAVFSLHQLSNKFRNNNYPIHFYALIWRNRNGRAINFIQLNCIICITNTLIEKWIWHDCLCWDFSSAHIDICLKYVILKINL